jgi:aryl-alcohol dehydrogenase-like predicted oxidoreductase
LANLSAAVIVIFVIAAMSLLDNKTNPTLRVITKNMMRSVEQSLKRLQVDFVDVLYLHIWDDLTLDEILRGLMILSNRESKLYRHQ